MSKLVNLVRFVWCILSLGLLVGCIEPINIIDAKPTDTPQIETIGDFPIYPGAAELKPEEGRFNSAVDENSNDEVNELLMPYRAGMALEDFIGGGTNKNEVREFSLPPNFSCKEAVAFYTKMMSNSGWLDRRKSSVQSSEKWMPEIYDKGDQAVYTGCLSDKETSSIYLFIWMSSKIVSKIKGINDVPAFPDAHKVEYEGYSFFIDFLTKRISERSSEERPLKTIGYTISSKPSCDDILVFYQKTFQEAGWLTMISGADRQSSLVTFIFGGQIMSVTCIEEERSTVFVLMSENEPDSIVK